MIDADRVLRPLRDEEAAIDRLTAYESPRELADAIVRVAAALDDVLRHLLRADPGTPDAVRLSALAPAELSQDDVTAALRRRDLISLRLAGRMHALRQTAERARTGEVRATDADAMLEAVRLLRTEVHDIADVPVQESARSTVARQVLEETPHEVPRYAAASAGSRRSIIWLVTIVALVVLSSIAAILLLRRAGATAHGIEAFRAGRMDSAAVLFRQAIERDSGNITALLYLARIRRREARYDDAAAALRVAAERARADPDVRRELGYLFLDLGSPAPAVEQFRRAQELDPADSRNWLGLIRALRAASDPAADDVARRAPPEVRALLTPGTTASDTF